MAISNEHPTSPTDPNRGLNTRVFLVTVAIAAVLIMAILMLVVRKGSHAVPKPTQTSSPSSQLGPAPLPAFPMPAMPVRIATKPSPLHADAGRVSTRATRLP